MLLSSEIENLQKYLSTQPVRKAFVFGSVARNEEQFESDVDLLVELDQHARVGLITFNAIKLGIEKILQKKVDLLSEGGVSPYLAPAIEKEKKLIYEKRA
jgi:predicted nucleotidyltransferase